MLFAGVAAWAPKPLPTVRIGIEAPAGTNSHYFVTKPAGLFQKHGVNMELIAFPGGTVGMQSLIAGVCNSPLRAAGRRGGQSERFAALKAGLVDADAAIVSPPLTSCTSMWLSWRRKGF